MRKHLPLIAILALALVSTAPAGEIVERTYTNSKGQPITLKVFSTQGSSTSSGSRTTSSSNRRLTRSSYVPYAYTYTTGTRYSTSYRAPVIRSRSCAVPYRPSIRIGGTSSRAAVSIRLGR